MAHLSWNEVRDRDLRFSRDPQNVTVTSERAHKQTFYNAFFDVFGLRRASIASFEENVRNLKGNTSAIDLLWKGKLVQKPLIMLSPRRRVPCVERRRRISGRLFLRGKLC